MEWRRARGAGTLDGLTAEPKAGAKNPTQAENDRLRRENEQLQRELAKTRAALDVVGQAHALLGLISESADTEPRGAHHDRSEDEEEEERADAVEWDGLT